MEETQVARASQNASVFPSENLQKRSLFGVPGNLGNLRPNRDRRSKRVTPTPENFSAVGPHFPFLTTLSLLPRRQYLTGSHHRTLVRFTSLRTGNPVCHMGSASALLQAQSDLVSLWAVVLAQCDLETLWSRQTRRDRGSERNR